jgi:hypothetical protein
MMDPPVRTTPTAMSAQQQSSGSQFTSASNILCAIRNAVTGAPAHIGCHTDTSLAVIAGLSQCSDCIIHRRCMS